MSSREEEKAKRIEQLRTHAEQWLHKQESTARNQTLYDLQSLVHELQVHQVELEMQQEELLLSRVELENSRNQYSTLYESAPVACFTLDKYGQILKANRMGSQLLGVASSQLAGEHFRNWVTAAEQIVFYRFIKQVFDTGAKQSCEVSLVHQHGQQLYAHLEAQVVSWAGEPPQCLLAAIDITTKKEAEQKLQQREADLKAANEQLESLVAQRTRHLEQALQTLQAQASALSQTNEQLRHVNNDLDNFVYTASHDLKAPILNIEGLLAILLKRLPGELLQTGEIPDIMRHMQDSVNRFKQTIADLTEVSSLQRTEAADVSGANLSEVLQEVTLDLAPLIEQTDARLTVDLENCQPVFCSRKNLRSVLYNLLSNALKYRSPDRRPEVRIRCGETAEYSCLSVQDNGLGLHPEEISKLFHMFKRLHTHVEGTGVGLYMVKKIIDNAGGKIDVQSQPGVGTTFTVCFPR